jgi:hypothetical protein
MKKGLIYIIGLTLIVSNSITFLGGILGLIGFMNQSLEETIRLLNIQPIFPKLIYGGGWVLSQRLFTFLLVVRFVCARGGFVVVGGRWLRAWFPDRHRQSAA